VRTLEAHDRAVEVIGCPTDLADALVWLALIEDDAEPEWQDVENWLLAHFNAGDAESIVLGGLRAGEANAGLRGATPTEARWVLRIEPVAARPVLLRYAAGRLDDAGFTVETAHDYEGPDRLLVLSMLVELDKFARGEQPPPRPTTYRRFLHA
jgi:hypothetical protein